MKLIRFAERPFVAAGHEDPGRPGVWKKVLLERADFQAGHVQMVNWARLPAGNSFAAHYHEDMQEVFVLVEGTAELVADGRLVTLSRGDAILIEPGEVHRMTNRGPDEVAYLVLGVSRGAGGRTVIADHPPEVGP